MEPPLTPELALAYLRELSVDVSSAIVVDDEGRLLAGPPALRAPAAAVLEAPGAEHGLAIETDGGWVFAAASGGVGVLVTTGPLALAGLALHDVRAVAALLAGAPHDEPPNGPVREPRRATPASLRALGEAVQRATAEVVRPSSDDR
jgi:hypothetical protein